MHRLSRKVNKTAVRWLLEVSGREKRHVLALMLLQAVSGGTGALYALLMRGVVDAAQYGQRAAFFRYLWLILLMVAFQLGLGALLRHLYALASADMENCFKHRLMRQLLYRDYGAVSAVHSAEWLNRMTNDAVLVADSMVSLVPSLIGLLVQLAAALVMLVILDWRFVVVLVPAGFLMVFLTWLFRRFMKRLHKRVQETDGALRVFLQERLTAMPILRSFAAEKETETGADRKMAEHKAARMFRNRYSNIFNTGFSGAMRGMYLLGFFWCGYGILQGTVSFGTLTAITQLIGQVQSPFASLSGFLTRFYTMLASAERLMEIEAYPGNEGTEIRSLAEAKDYYERKLYLLPRGGKAGGTEQGAPARRPAGSFPLGSKRGDRGLHGTQRLRQVHRPEGPDVPLHPGCGRAPASGPRGGGDPPHAGVAEALCLRPAGEPPHERHHPRGGELCRRLPGLR